VTVLARREVALDISEKEWQAQVVDLAKLLRWRHYYTFSSRRSPPGFPDLVLLRERVVYAELKSSTGELSATQDGWLQALEAAGAECYVWRPRDLEQVARVLR
jgi:hypothetical protein